uniref:ShKT domain-containing protein n=1 Tax=Caenorhabditis japonica TaxID=281687 RepID=A0A8R1DUY1_CAEJA
MFSLLASAFLTVFLNPLVINADVGPDLNCTSFNGTGFVYTPLAVACSNAIADSACEKLYAADETAAAYPAAGMDTPRPMACFSTSAETPAPIDSDMKKAALTSCAKTCGLCCQTDDYNCPNVAFPRLKCDTITTAQCNSAQWRTIIATDCPSACGFCNQGGCVDAVVECANDISICQTVGMQDFVNENCQRTCGRCASTTVAGAVTTGNSGGGSGCSSYQADSSSACASWATNGFCENSFYTTAQRKSYCATTCKLC